MTMRASLPPAPAVAICVSGVPAAVLSVAVVVAAVGVVLLDHPGWAAEQVVIGLAGYAAVGTAVGLMATWRQGVRRFGLANQVTLLRAGLTCLMGAALFLGGGAAGAGWPLVALAIAALGLDGLDGWLARRLRLVSAFGARFDLEVDALLLLTLALLVWQAGRAGPWVLAIGLMRYAFLFAGHLVPVLRRPLLPSRRRKTVCALQGVTLVICLLPPLPAAPAPWLAGAALLALTTSFASDIRWLLRVGRKVPLPGAGA